MVLAGKIYKWEARLETLLTLKSRVTDYQSSFAKEKHISLNKMNNIAIILIGFILVFSSVNCEAQFAGYPPYGPHAELHSWRAGAPVEPSLSQDGRFFGGIPGVALTITVSTVTSTSLATATTTCTFTTAAVNPCVANGRSLKFPSRLELFHKESFDRNIFVEVE